MLQMLKKALLHALQQNQVANLPAVSRMQNQVLKHLAINLLLTQVLKNSKGTYNKNYNSYNNKGYKKQYTEYLNNNYRNSGFFSGSSITNALLWYTLFNSTASRNHIHASDKQKELVDNVKDSKVPVYMLEIKTKDGEIKHVTVTKEQYDKVKVGDNISLKDGNLEIKN